MIENQRVIVLFRKVSHKTKLFAMPMKINCPADLVVTLIVFPDVLPEKMTLNTFERLTILPASV